MSSNVNMFGSGRGAAGGGAAPAVRGDARRALANSVTIGSMWTLALALGACAPPPYTPPAVDTGEDTAVNEEDTAPGIEITWPAPESQVTGCAMLVVQLLNVKLVDPAVRPDVVDGEGHYHLLYEGHYTPCYTPYCLIGLADAGTDQVEAQLVHTDHTPYVDDENNPIESTLLLNVLDGECTLGTPSASY